MADSVLRTLARRLEATGSPADELAWLHERVRVGDRLDGASYARLAALDPQAAADALAGRAERGELDGVRLGLAAAGGHVPARLAQRWGDLEGDLGLDVLAWYARREGRSRAAFELVSALVADLVDRAAGAGLLSDRERTAIRDALADCSPFTSWSPRASSRLEVELRRPGGPAHGPARAATERAVALLGGHRRGRERLGEALAAVGEATAALGGASPRWGDLIAPALLVGAPPPRPEQVASEDGFVRLRCPRSREYVARRLRATKEFLSSGEECGLAFQLGRVHLGRFFAGMRALFGPPHDLFDHWKESSSYVLDARVTPARRGRADLRPVTLLLRVSDRKGGLEVQLRMPRRPAGPESLEAGHDVLPPRLRVEALAFFVGLVEGFARGCPLSDFERELPDGEERGLRYGVRGGVPFDERLPPAAAAPPAAGAPPAPSRAHVPGTSDAVARPAR